MSTVTATGQAAPAEISSTESTSADGNAAPTTASAAATGTLDAGAAAAAHDEQMAKMQPKEDSAKDSTTKTNDQPDSLKYPTSSTA